MSNTRQISANRANSQKSTGPVTPEGKKAVSQNAIRHGLLSKGSLIRGEDPAEYQQFRDSLIADLAPVGDMELLLADRIAGGFWKLRRAGLLEVALLDYAVNDQFDSDVRFGSPHKYQIISDSDSQQDESSVESEDGGNEPMESSGDNPEESVEEEEDWDEEQCREYMIKTMIKAHARDMYTHDKISRFQKYEVQIENMIYRNLNLLQRCQFLRARRSEVPTVVESILRQRGRENTKNIVADPT